MGTREDILSLAAEFSSNKSNGTEQSDLLGAFGLEGADATDFLAEYMERFNVDMSALHWEFHFNADEPPRGRRRVPVDHERKKIPYMPITLDQLVAAAEQGYWRCDYPESTWRRGRPSRASLVTFALSVMFLIVVYSIS